VLIEENENAHQEEAEDLKTKRDFLIIAFVYLAITMVAIVVLQNLLPYPFGPIMSWVAVGVFAIAILKNRRQWRNATASQDVQIS